MSLGTVRGARDRRPLRRARRRRQGAARRARAPFAGEAARAAGGVFCEAQEETQEEIQEAGHLATSWSYAT